MREQHRERAHNLGLSTQAHMLIGGELRAAEDNAAFATVDPTTGDTLTQVPNASVADIDAAVAAARRAFDETSWSRDVTLRKRTLLELSRLAERERDDFADTDTLEVGMITTVARRFGARALVRNLEYFSTWADKVYGEVVPMPSGKVFDFTRREPFGVVAAIYAWNTPSLFLGSKLGPALAAGNTVVIKPSELGSLSALRLARLCREAGVPNGVVNIVTGGREAGARLVSHRDIDKITFTGGTATGSAVQAAAAANLTPVHLELGGKSPHVVLADAPLERALPAVLSGALALSGQACAAGSRVLVDRAIHDAFVERLADTAGMLAIGDPLEPTTMIGPLISEAHRDRVLGYIETGKSEGARLVCGGAAYGDTGYFVEPTVFADVDPDMTIACEEIFGPVISVLRVDGIDHAIEVANRSDYGLAAGIWTRDLRNALRFAEAVRTGNVWINGYGTISHTTPFGGYRRSGIGREGGRDAILEYTQVKNVAVDLG